MIACCLSLLIASAANYRTVPIEWWNLRVESQFIEEQPLLWTSVNREVTRQLQGIARVVPDGPLGKLREVPIWVHLKSPGNVCMAYHPSADWLKEHKMNPEMASCVEIGNAQNFVSWTYEQPWMILHELAHAYHFRVLKDGAQNPDVLAAYRNAVDTKIYDSVRHWNGSLERHYATTNQMEYFAETTEAYFGANDFFPFVRAELKIADPKGEALMVSVWGEPQKRIPSLAGGS